jgi:hypothetical protein
MLVLEYINSAGQLIKKLVSGILDSRHYYLQWGAKNDIRYIESFHFASYPVSRRI